MAEKDEPETRPKSRSRGVTINEALLTDEKPEKDTSDLESSSFSQSPSKSLKKIKQEVQTIIDIMGPSTPHSSFATSNDADNEESIYSNSKYSSKIQTQTDTTTPGSDTAPNTDISLREDPTDVSLVVAKSSSTYDSSHQKPLLQLDACQCGALGAGELPQYICPPPLMPANMCVNSECVCPQIAGYLQSNTRAYLYDPCEDVRAEPKPIKSKKGSFIDWLKNLRSHSKPTKCDTPGEFYRMNIKHHRNDDHSPPRKFTFELVNESKCNTKSKTRASNPYCGNIFCKNDDCTHDGKMKKPEREVIFSQDVNPTAKDGCCNIDCPANEGNYEADCKSNLNGGSDIFRTESKIPPESCCGSDVKTENKKFVGHTTYYDTLHKTKVDVYYFDHGNSRYYKTTDRAPLILTEDVAEKTQGSATKFWAEIFGIFHVGLAFITSFILQLIRFILYGLLRPLTVGAIQLVSDYLFKPCLATCFNAIIQPIMIFIFNVFTSLRDICDPIAEGIGYFIRELAVLIGACRLIEVNKNCGSQECSGDFRRQRTRR